MKKNLKIIWEYSSYNTYHSIHLPSPLSLLPPSFSSLPRYPNLAQQRRDRDDKERKKNNELKKQQKLKEREEASQKAKREEERSYDALFGGDCGDSFVPTEDMSVADYEDDFM